MNKILTAMSGGVDSAVAAARLLSQGMEVSGATMLLCEAGADEAEAAARSARALGMEFYTFDFRREFAALVQQPFIDIYCAGRTPNPCVICNKQVKFGLFLERALALGFDGVATGHYARVEFDEASGRYLVKCAADTAKDQTYMLWSLSQKQLSHIVLPMGDITKQQARAQAAALRLPVAGKHDSQDICFIPDGDYLKFLLAHGVTPTPGRFVDAAGKDYGPHRGQEAYTIGQRRGLEIAYGSRIYVTGKQGGNVVIGPNEALFSTRVAIENVNWIPFDTPGGELRAEAKLRYTPKTAKCTVRPTEFGAELIFDEPQRAATPGQSAVLYDGDTLLGGGIIR